ncbi:uncharacterized protein LOC134260080 [Saccostrea cucullata]|uniref:uncharacterized protein LOC134260080 n=1 Tax=Saccostrea cuccullata TaxID=36930 RepID=UPI002ED21310
MHEFTDGCAAQYKSRHCFGDISNSCQDFGFKHFTRNFFETAHAKGPHDFAISNLTMTKSVCRRSIFRFMDCIPRDDNLRFKSVPNIRSVHQVIVRDSDDEITTRELSCFCDKCDSHSYDECLNIPAAGHFLNIKMIQETDTTTDVDQDDDQGSMAKLVSKGQVIAVYADDPHQDYFLIKVQEPAHTLDSDKTDSWGSTLPAGTDVITGLYYDNTKQNPLRYKLLRRRKAIVPASAAVYICSEVDARVTIDLDEDVHLNILHAINGILMS